MHKKLAPTCEMRGESMYKRDNGQLHMFDYTLSDTFTLDPNNRWVKMARLVPWDLAEAKYEHMFAKNGRPAKSIRMALGALLIQETLKASDEETLQAITEGPYLQHFIGLKHFVNQPPFDSSLMVWFRKRLSAKFMAQINDAMVKEAAEPPKEEVKQPEDDDDEPHGGTLVVDATCAPSNITYPTDTGLIRGAAEKSDEIIDEMQKTRQGKRRPRTYRQLSRKAFVGFIKQRRPSKIVIRKCKRAQLGYLKRNLSAIDKLFSEGRKINEKRLGALAVLRKVYEQQLEMHRNRVNRVANRIVSLSQPHIRPIVRGKAGAAVEFGAKIDMSVVNGYVFVNEISYDAFAEGNLLENAIIDYYKRFKMLPKEILADRAYQTRENRMLCKELGVRLMGKPLGRPGKTPYDNTAGDVGRRNIVEARFGTLKTRYGWNRIMARLPETGMTAIWVAALAFNLSRLVKLFLSFCLWMSMCRKKTTHSAYRLNLAFIQWTPRYASTPARRSSRPGCSPRSSTALKCSMPRGGAASTCKGW